MKREEAKSCIGTIEMLQRLAYNIHGVMDVIDADNCNKIIKALEQELRKDEVILTNKEYRELMANEYDHGYCKGYAVALEEQESILNKIRAEITEYGSIWVAYAITGHSDRDIENLIEGVLKQAKEQVLNIINKYRTESEE